MAGLNQPGEMHCHVGPSEAAVRSSTDTSSADTTQGAAWPSRRPNGPRVRPPAPLPEAAVSNPQPVHARHGSRYMTMPDRGTATSAFETRRCQGAHCQDRRVVLRRVAVRQPLARSLRVRHVLPRRPAPVRPGLFAPSSRRSVYALELYEYRPNADAQPPPHGDVACGGCEP